MTGAAARRDTRIALASARRTGKLPQSTVMELREWMARTSEMTSTAAERELGRSGSAEPAAAAAIAVFVLQPRDARSARGSSNMCSSSRPARSVSSSAFPITSLFRFRCCWRSRLWCARRASYCWSASPRSRSRPACNVVLGTYHAGVEWHWWAGPTDCSGPLTDLRTGGSLLDQLHADPCRALRRGRMAFSRAVARRLQCADFARARDHRRLRALCRSARARRCIARDGALIEKTDPTD